LLAAAAAGRPVLLKKGQFLAPDDMGHALAKLAAAPAVWLCERGTSFGYHDLVVDMRALCVMAELAHARPGARVVFDATHAVQRPGGADGVSGGQRRFIP